MSWDAVLFSPPLTQVVPDRCFNSSGRMGIVRKYGKPDLFITFTCNPQWEEITSALLLNQKASDRPDLIVRVFRLNCGNY